jgi:hypothetical protein
MTTGRINQVTILQKAVAADRPEGRPGFITKRRRGRRSAVTSEARSHRRTTVNQNQLLDLLVDDRRATTVHGHTAQSQLRRELRRTENRVFKRPS